MQQRPVLTLAASNDRRPRKRLQAPAWNHQHDLKDLKGKAVTLVFVDGEQMDVTLLEADQFTLKCKQANGEVFVWFKSALVGFGPSTLGN